MNDNRIYWKSWQTAGTDEDVQADVTGMLHMVRIMTNLRALHRFTESVLSKMYNQLVGDQGFVS